MDTRRDLGVCLGVVLLGLFILYGAFRIEQGIYKDAIGSSSFPYALGAVITLGGGVLVLRRLRDLRRDEGYVAPAEGTADEAGHPASALRAASVMGATLAYILLMVPLGYLLATPLFVATALVVMKERRPGVVASCALLWTIGSYLIFAQFLRVRLPLGPLEEWFRTLGLN